MEVINLVEGYGVIQRQWYTCIYSEAKIKVPQARGWLPRTKTKQNNKSKTIPRCKSHTQKPPRVQGLNKELSNLTNISHFTLLPLSHDALVIARPDVLEGALEVALRPVKAGVRFVFAGLQVGVDELDETVEVLGGDGLVLLVKVVDVSVEDLDKEFDGNSSVHAGICDSQSALETLEDSFPITIELAASQY